MTPQTVDPNRKQAPGPRLWFAMMLPYLVIPLVLLICGGDFSWWQAWGYSVMLFLGGFVGRILAEKRHPGYAGNLLAVAGIVMALNSLWTLIPAVAALVIAVIRTSLEDRTLHEELTGYREYAKRVRFRLFPGIY